MTVGVATCPPETPLAQVARLLVENALEALVVLDPEEGHALGVVGQDELVRAYHHAGARELTAAQAMREGVPQCPADIPLAAAAQLMLDQGVRILFMMHHSGGVEYPAASIAYRHILRHLAAENEEDLKDLGMHARRVSPRDAFIQRREEARRRNTG
ncbi:MAG: CBS domain-containing protein [Chloroflexota bacterium]